ncbi:MAG: ATP-binding cassette domain-containing protein, partial [Anaerotardibacter sp.]
MIAFNNISFTYDNQDWPLKEVTEHITPGEFVCILGGNGSGKSTLAKHINALLIPDKGEVCVNGLSSSNLDNLFSIRSVAGMVFQNPDDQIVASAVQDDVAFGPENLGIESSEIVERVKKALEQVGLEAFGSHETFALSGGQKQRVAIAGVLAMHPQILVFD